MRLYDYAASANCFKVRLLLSLLGIDCALIATDIFAGDTLTDDYARLNPARETPVLELDDGRVIAQSGAILTYLAHGTPWLPAERFEQARVAQWLAFEQERVMGGIGGPRFRLATGRAEPGSPAIEARLAIGRDAMATLDEVLARQPWLVGAAPTIADLAVYGYAHTAPEVGVTGFGAVDAWCERLRALPGFTAELAPYPQNARPGASRSIYD